MADPRTGEAIRTGRARGFPDEATLRALLRRQWISQEEYEELAARLGVARPGEAAAGVEEAAALAGREEAAALAAPVPGNGRPPAPRKKPTPRAAPGPPLAPSVPPGATGAGAIAGAGVPEPEPETGAGDQPPPEPPFPPPLSPEEAALIFRPPAKPPPVPAEAETGAGDQPPPPEPEAIAVGPTGIPTLRFPAYDPMLAFGLPKYIQTGIELLPSEGLKREAAERFQELALRLARDPAGVPLEEQPDALPVEVEAEFGWLYRKAAAPSFPVMAAAHVAAPVVRAAGVLGGLVEGVLGGAEAADEAFVRAMTGARRMSVETGEPLPVPVYFDSQIARIYNLTEDDLRARMASHTGRPIDEFVGDLVSDLSDNMAGLYSLAKDLLATTIEDEAYAGDVADFVDSQWGAGKDLGQLFVGGLAGGSAALLKNLPDTVQTRPVTFALMFAPFLRAARASGRLPTRLGRVADSIDRAASAVTTAVVSSAKLPAFVIKNALQDVVRERGGATAGVLGTLKTAAATGVRGAVKATAEGVATMREGEPVTILRPAEWAGVQRWVNDSLRQENYQTQAVVDRVIREPAQVRAEILALSRQFAREYERDPSLLGEPGVWPELSPEATAVADAYLAQRLAAIDKAPSATLAAQALHLSMRRLKLRQADLAPLVEATEAAIERHRATPWDLPGEAARGAADVARAEKVMAGLKMAEPESVAVAGEEADRFDTQLILEFEKLPGETARYTQETMDLLNRVGAKITDVRDVGPSVLFEALQETGGLRPDDPLSVFRKPHDVVTARRLSAMEVPAPNLSAPAAAELLAPIAAHAQGVLKTASLFRPRKRGGFRVLQEVEEARLGPELTAERAARVLTSVFVEESAQLLRVPSFRNAVSKRIREKVPKGFTLKGLESELKEIGEASLLPTALDFKVTVIPAKGEPTTLFFLNEAFEAFRALPEAEQRAFRAEAFQRVGAVVAGEVQRAHIRKAMEAEIDRGQFGAETGDMPGFLNGMVDAVLLTDPPEPLPQLLTRYHPVEVANALDAGVAAVDSPLVGRVAEKLDILRSEAEKRLYDLSHEFRFGYSPPMHALVDALPGAKVLTEGEKTISLPGVSVTAVAKGFNASVGWHLRVMDALEVTDTFMSRLNHLIKRNLTVLNLPTHKNNLLANFLLLALQRAITPIGVGESLYRTGADWVRYRKGTLSDPAIVADLQTLERVNLVNTSLLEGELGILEMGEKRANVIAQVQDALGAKKAEAGYRFGDTLFKLDVGLRALRSARRQVDALKPGEWVRALEREDKEVWLLKGEGGKFYRVQTQPKANLRVNLKLVEKDVGTTEAPGPRTYFEEISPEEVRNTLGRAAAKPAHDLFFDYTEVPMILQAMRVAPGLGVISPFLTWAFKAVDLPGLKRGLGAHLLAGDSELAMVSNSAAVNTANVAAMLELSARRAMLAGILRAELLSNDADELREWFDRSPREVGVTLVNWATDPGYVMVDRYDHANSLAPSANALRLLLWGAREIQDMLEPDSADVKLWDRTLPLDEVLDERALVHKHGMTPEAARDVVQRRRFVLDAQEHGITFKTALGLGGVSATPLVEAYMDMAAADERGASVLAAGARSLWPLLIGGTPAAARRVWKAVVDPSDEATAYRFAMREDPRESEELLRWSVRQIVGLGWMERHTAVQRSEYISKMSQLLREGLVREAQRRREVFEGLKAQAEVEGDGERAARLRETIEAFGQLGNTMAGVVETEIDRIKIRYDEVVRRVMPPERPGLPAPPPAATLPAEPAPAGP